jgi:hypothetical protein
VHVTRRASTKLFAPHSSSADTRGLLLYLRVAVIVALFSATSGSESYRSGMSIATSIGHRCKPLAGSGGGYIAVSALL